jgi:hypothetical protein
MAVRAAVASGDVAGAIERVNDLDPEVLEARPALLFALQRQRLIELIRAGDVAGALEFASEYLAPHAADNPAFLEEVERAMALLAWETPGEAPPGLAGLLAPAQRGAAAGELNAAILNAQGQESGACGVCGACACACACGVRACVRVCGVCAARATAR